MAVDRSHQIGFGARPIVEWLPELIRAKAVAAG
jgi:hypothetical protein